VTSARERLESRGVWVRIWSPREVAGWVPDKLGSVCEYSAARTVVNLRPGLSPRELEMWLCFALRLLTGEEEPTPGWGMGYCQDRGAWRAAELYRPERGERAAPLTVAAVLDAPALPSTRLMARPQRRHLLCCACGTVRTTTWQGQLEAEPRDGQEAGGRCLVARPCATCHDRTVHAYLREPDDPWRDRAEWTPEERHERQRREVLQGPGWDMGPYDPRIDDA
jgi:hypothetical protein